MKYFQQYEKYEVALCPDYHDLDHGFGKMNGNTIRGRSAYGMDITKSLKQPRS
ncbi:hypothetical protein FACS189472_05780 [Alphaproteobacteria bacterium]|nr:hypothetical protein FACS189472_05780 [Alphaproteobacteria bacterium]